MSRPSRLTSSAIALGRTFVIPLPSLTQSESTLMAAEMNGSQDAFAGWAVLRASEAETGESRLNLIRLCAILVFYAYHLTNFYLLDPGGIGLEFHLQVSALVLAWSSEVVVLYYGAGRQWLRMPSVKYVATGWDIAMISCLLVLCDRPSGAFLMLYLLVIASCGLRLSLKLTYFATLASVVGYLITLGHYVFYAVGYQAYYVTPALRLSRTEQVLVVLAMLTAGFITGQAVRQARRLACSLAVMED